MIKILLDPTIFNEQKFGGISRSYIEIYEELIKTATIKIDCPLFYSENVHFQGSSLFADSFQKQRQFLIKLNKVFRNYGPNALKRKNVQKTIDLLQSQNFDLFIPTYYDTYFLEYLNGKPFVLTVYDMIHELFPQYFTEDTITVPNKKILLEKATKIITISNSTKKDILNIYPNIDPAKIEVIYLAPSIKPECLIQPALPENYVLFVGNRGLYKNFNFFLRAIAPVLKSNPQLYLMCAGGNPFNAQEIELINEFEVTEQVMQQNFQDTELATYYKKALCFVFPSEYEGFGIPVLESMCCGCPTLLANRSSFPEIAGDATLYFELNNLPDLTQKITMLVSDSELRKEYALRGLEQASRFSWQKTTRESLKVYQQAISIATLSPELHQ